MTRRLAFLRKANWELAFLVGLLASLPLFEAPKNIFWLLFGIAWIVNRVRRRDFGGSWDRWDTLILLWIASSYSLALFAGQPNDEWDGANDVLRYASVLWMLKRSGYTAPELNLILRVTVGATLIALAWGLWAWLGTHEHRTLELNSVGHVNHSAIFLTIAFGIAVSSLLASGRQNRLFLVVGILVVIMIGAGVFVSASRGAVLALLGLTLLLGIVFARRSVWILTIMLLFAFASAATAYIAKIEVIRKQEANYAANNTLSHRDAIWNTALVLWRQYPWFGVGMHNFDQATPEETQAWATAQGKRYDAAKFMNSSHAHSLYLNSLAERGLIGSAILASVLIAWIVTLLRGLPSRNDVYIYWTAWGGALSAWFVTVVVGFVNTTLHHEHALLSMVALGIFLASRGTSNRDPV